MGKIPWRRKWQPTPVFLPGESHGLRSLVGYNPLGHNESDTTEHAHTHTHTHTTGSSFFLFLSASPSCDSSKPCPTWPSTTTNRRLRSAGSRGPHPISARLLPPRLPLDFSLASLTSCSSAGILPFIHWTRIFGLSGSG